MNKGRRYIAVLSGEHTTLPQAEFKAVLEAEGIRIHRAVKKERVLVVDLEREIPYEVAMRCGMLKALSQKLFTCPFNLKDIVLSAKELDLTNIISKEKSFAIRIWRLGSGTAKDVKILESKLGQIFSNSDDLRVDLERPEVTFLGCIIKDLFIFGLKTYERPPHLLESRMPKYRVAVHPSTMESKLARCMVNLSRVKEGRIFLDPFCGVGGILLEAASLKCRIIGCDINLEMASKCNINLKHYGFQPKGVILSDSAYMPIEKVHAIATDPPYGTAASTLKRGIKKILKDFLPEAAHSLSTRCYAVVAAPKNTGLIEAAEYANLKVTEVHEIYIHRRLTREIATLKKG